MFKRLDAAFQRALSFSKEKFLAVFVVLFFLGLLVIFFSAVALSSIFWIKMSLLFLPIFICLGILFSLGLLLIQSYALEREGKRESLLEILHNSYAIIITGGYLAFLPFLTSLLLWIAFGLFLLLKEIPYLGPVISVFLSVAPFLIFVASLILILLCMAFLFFASPFLALLKKDVIGKMLASLKSHLFSNLFFFGVGSLPLLALLIILILAGAFTSAAIGSTSILVIVLSRFFMMIPFCLFLTPVVIFFFQFALESYYLVEERDE